MKAISLLVSLTVFTVAGYYFVTDFKISGEINHLIYMSLLVVLMMICVVGILINMPMIIREKRKLNVLVYNKFTRRKERTKKFHIGLETS